MAPCSQVAASLTTAWRDLEILRSRWPRLLPEPVAGRALRLLKAALHLRRLEAAGRDPGDSLQEVLVSSQADLIAALGPAFSGPAQPFRDHVVARLLDDDSHPYLRQAAAAGPEAVAPVLAEGMAGDLRRLQVVSRGVDGALLCGLSPERQGAARQGCGDAQAAARLDPLAVPEPPWSVAGPRKRLRDRFLRGGDWGDLCRLLGNHVRRYGLGRAQGCPAYRFVVRGERAHLEPLSNFAAFDLDWLAGNAERIAVLEDNTRNLLDGFRAHNALIWGPRGCGKSSLIRGLITRYWKSGLRGIEVPPDGYSELRGLPGLVRGRTESFIAVLDNIGLDRTDSVARVLSSVLEGGLEGTPRNLVFYATSNFKDLVDRHGERGQSAGPLQADSVPPERRPMTPPGGGYDPQGFQRLDERRALDDRFALKVFLDLPTRTQYEQMVLAYARRAGIDDDDESLLADFQVWRLRHNHDLAGGRTARDFILARYPGHVRSTGETARRAR